MKLRFLNIDFGTLMMRYYLMMGIVIVSFFIGLPWLSILSLPVFFTALMGIRFERRTAPGTKAAKATRHTPKTTYTHEYQ